ncbi:hypothetical protein ACOSQ4_016279 [Xanthoceras sorbifolium]
MSSKKCGDAECCEKTVVHGIVLLLEDGIEHEYSGDHNVLDEYVPSIIENISKEESQQTLLTTNVD